MATVFPHLTSTGFAPTHHEVAHRYRTIFAESVAQGKLRPLVLPYHLYGIFVLTAYLCIPHTNRPWMYKARWGVLAGMTWWQWKTLQETSSASFAIAFAAGLTAAWGFVWTATWLVWCRPQFDAKRVERRVKLTKGQGTTDTLENHMEQNGLAQSSRWKVVNGEAPSLGLRERVNGKSELSNINGIADGSAATPDAQIGTEKWEYFWQPYPESVLERLSWIIDLIANFRGPGWNWAIPPIPPLPPAIKQQLDGLSNQVPQSSLLKSTSKIFSTHSQLANYRIPQFIVGYLILDILKTTMMKDPYFIFGPTTYALPPYLQSISPPLLLLYRHVIVALAVVISLEMTFMLAPILFSLCLGGYSHSTDLRLEPWYYPPTWGRLGSILDKGLSGLWGSWWHQTFRFAFAAPTNWAVAKGYLNPKSPSGNILGLLCAFGISGLLHSAGSMTQLPRTYPWHAPVFFMLQALGIVVQMAVSSALKRLTRELPAAVRKAGNLAFTLVWLHLTCHWLVDDFARGGIWLYEPIPVSPLRGMGFGVEGDGWWCWEHIGASWYTGKHWWESGIAI